MVSHAETVDMDGAILSIGSAYDDTMFISPCGAILSIGNAYDNTVFISPQTAVCVFNYNIGPYTFITGTLQGMCMYVCAQYCMCTCQVSMHAMCVVICPPYASGSRCCSSPVSIFVCRRDLLLHANSSECSHEMSLQHPLHRHPLLRGVCAQTHLEERWGHFLH